MTDRQPSCVAATLALHADPAYPASYHWCAGDFHHGPLHTCFCGKNWDQNSEPLAALTPEMISWRQNC